MFEDFAIQKNSVGFYVLVIQKLAIPPYVGVELGDILPLSDDELLKIY